MAGQPSLLGRVLAKVLVGSMLAAPHVALGDSGGAPMAPPQRTVFDGPIPQPDAESIELRLAAGVFRPTTAESAAAPAWFREAPQSASARGLRYLVAITRSSLDPEQRRQVEAAGAELLDYLPVRGYRLRLDPGAERAVRALPFVVWVGALPAHFKVEASLSSRLSGSVRVGGFTPEAGSRDAGRRSAALVEPATDVSLRVIVFAGEPETRVLEAIESVAGAGGSAPGEGTGRRPAVMRAVPSGKDGAWRVTATVPEESIAAVVSLVAALPEVEAVELVHHFRLLNQDAVWVHQSFVGPSPQQTPVFAQGIFGCGQIVGIADSGQDYDACHFRDTVNGPPPVVACASAPCPPASPALNRRKDILYYNWSGTPNGDDDTCPATITGASGHGTHTSGSIAGDTTPYANCATFASPGRNGGDGQAPGAKLVVQEMGDGLEYLNFRGGTVWNLADVAYQNGARIHSNSWGGGCLDPLGGCVPGCTIPYDSFARDADLAMWTHQDLLLVASSGNSGCPAPDAVTTPGIAKSPLTVGSVGHGTGAGAPSIFSSQGPVFDGRLKPTMMAQGESTVSVASDANPNTNNCGTCSLDGTSMSAPTAAGIAALVREYYAAGYYATGGRSPAQGFSPSGALVKATLLEGAVALGAAAPSPGFDSGYGRALLNATLTFTGSPFKLRVDDHREGMTTGSVVTHAYDVSAGTPLRATLVWTDYPAAIGAATARVNELKLEVVDPDGNTWFQTLDPGTGAPAQTMDPSDPHDGVNVEERLVFGSPAAGRWIVRVRGVDVPWGPQPFALVVRGALNDCLAPEAPDAPTLAPPPTTSTGASGRVRPLPMRRRPDDRRVS